MQAYYAIYNFFSNGNAPYLMVGISGFVTYVFAVTFFVSLFASDIRLSSKRFFIWFIVFGSVACMGCSLLDFLSARVFTLFGCVLYPVLLTALFMVEYGILAIQSKIGKRVVGVLHVSQPQTGSLAKCDYTKKREKKAAICEDPFRKTQLVRMETPRSDEPFGENYLMECLSYLKSQPLNTGERLRLSEISKRITFPIVADTREKRLALCSDCGEIITMLAKYK